MNRNVLYNKKIINKQHVTISESGGLSSSTYLSIVYALLKTYVLYF